MHRRCRRSSEHAAILFALLSLWCLAPSSELGAQRGDRAGQAQPENWRQWEIPPAPPLDPDDALASFRIAPGFRVELAASEPLIVDPIAIRFDPAGRLWAIELRAYMPTVDGEGETAPLGQVVVLEDDDHDGRYDRSTVFLGGLVNARALTLVEDGVLVAEPPYLWYCRDTDGDLRSDWKIELTRYGNPDPDHLEHTENGLLRNLDNWLYNAKSSRRLKFSLGEDGVPRLEEEPTAFRGQWGITHDDRGRLFYNGNSNYLFGDPWPAEYLLRGAPCGRAIGQTAGIGERIVGRESVHSIRVNTGINRGYQKGMLRADGRLARTTSVSGGVIYRGDQFPPEFHGDAFIPEPAGNVVAHFRLDPKTLRGSQLLVPDPDWGDRAFLASTDERFRPVDCAIGPDGALYVVDLYRGILQHRQFVTSYLRKQILERGLDQPVGLGRIWRVVAEATPIDRTAPSRHFSDTMACLEALGHRNGWVRDTAQRLLIEREDRTALSPLRGVAREGSALARIHALWTLEGLDAVDLESVRAGLTHENAAVRIASLRVAERLAATPLARAVVRELGKRIEDPDRAVRIQSVFSLGAFHGTSDASMLRTLVAVEAEPEDRELALAALSGWGGRQLEILDRLAMKPSWPRAGRVIIADLAASAARHSTDAILPILELADHILDHHPTRALAMLDGLERIVGGHRFAPVSLPAVPRLFLRTDRSDELRQRLETLTEKLRWGEDATPPPPPLPPLEGVAAVRAERGRTLFGTCAICHGPAGEGLRGLGPPLRGSPRVEHDEEALVRIILDGLTGPLEVEGEIWNATMPGQRENSVFDDAAVAGLATWLRRQWGHRGAPISPEQVAAIRTSTRDRIQPWSDAELRGEGVEESSVPLFDGRTLSGWSRHGGSANYTVEESSIVGRTVPRSPNTFLCTDRTFGDFELTYEFKVDSALNSGVQIRSRIGDNDRVRGYQVEIDVDHVRARYWSGGIYEEGGRGWLDDLSDDPEARQAARSEEWNRVRVVADGGRLRTWIGGIPTADLLDAEALEGIIGLQVHGVGNVEKPLEVRWRNLEIIDRGRSAFVATTREDWIEPASSKPAMWSREESRWTGTPTASEGLAATGPVETVRIQASLTRGAKLQVLGAVITEAGVGIVGSSETKAWPDGSTKILSPSVVVQRVGDRVAVSVEGKRLLDVRGVASAPRIAVEGPPRSRVMIESLEVLRKVKGSD